jgi:hypothetical protein
LDQQCTLPDPDRWLDRDAMQTRLYFGNRSLVPSGGQLLQRGPLLAGWSNVLPLIAADRADSAWLIGVGMLYGAGTADPDRQDSSLGFHD